MIPKHRTITTLRHIHPKVILLATFCLIMTGRSQPTLKVTSPSGPSSTNLLGITLDEINSIWQKASVEAETAAAEGGDPTAQCHLAWRLQKGEGVAKDLINAAKWMRKAADQKLAAGENGLGLMYELGLGVPEDRDVAMDWVRKAAEQGYVSAEVNLGRMYANEKAKPGETIRGNYPVAAEWYEKAARKGNGIAQFKLAELYRYRKLGDLARSNCIPWYVKAAEQGIAPAQTAVAELANEFSGHPLLQPHKIIPFVRQAAEKGNLDAQWELARRCRQGDGVPKDPSEGFKWMRRAAESQQDSTRVADAWYQLAIMYEMGEGTAKNPSAAWPLYLSAAASNPDAVFRAGRMYEEGTGVPQNDRTAAEYYTRAMNMNWGEHLTDAADHLARLYTAGRGLSKDKTEAEEQINVLARSSASNGKIRFQLGNIYFQGTLVAKDIEAAVQHYTVAARMGSVEAMNRIGEMWAAGLNGKPDFAQAAACYRKAAVRGLAEAQFNLGMCYAKGEGLPADRVEAWRWLQSATLQRFESATKELAKVENEMNADELARAKAKGLPVISSQ